MGYPSISQWIDTVANPHGRFRTLGRFEPMRDAYGQVRFTAGNSAAVFRIRSGNRQMALKCFIKEGRNRKSLYRTTKGCDPLLSPTNVLPGEAYVYDDFGRGAFYDIAVGPWVEGVTLETEIRRAAHEFGAQHFAQLSAEFERLAAELLSREWAHGDLKPDNIVITLEGNAVLIDYDAMYVPGCQPSGEAGTPGFQHPVRTEADYGKYLDDYPIALIATCLRALALQPDLYGKYHKGDGLILNPQQVCTGDSAAYHEILRLFADRGDYASYRLASLLRRPTPAIPHLSRALERTEHVTHPNAADDMPRLFESDGLWGYCRKDGREAVAAIFDEAFEFSNGLGVARIGSAWHAIDTAGNMVFSSDGFDALKPFGDGLAAFRCGHKWGYADTLGHVTVEPRFDSAGMFHDGRAAVGRDGKYGYIDTSGREVVPAVYDRARGFRNGTAEVESGDEIFRIDHNGERV